MNNSQIFPQLKNKFKGTSVKRPKKIGVNRSFGTILNINLKLGFRNPSIISTGVIFSLISIVLTTMSMGVYTSVASTSFLLLVFDIFITFLLGLLITLSSHYYFRKQITEGIHNIELRGGINSLSSFWMRILCQQILTLTYISIYVITSILIVYTNNSIELLEFKTRFYIWIVFIYFINIFITAIALFIFSFSTSAVGVLLSVLVTIFFSTTSAVSTIIASIFKVQDKPASLSTVSSINLNALFGKQIYEEFKNDTDIGFLFTDGNGDDLYKQLDIESPSDIHGDGASSISKEVMLSGLVYDSETVEEFGYEDENPNAPNISMNGTIIKNPKIANSKIYKTIFEKILNNVNRGQYNSKFKGETNIIFFPTDERANQDKSKVVADDIVDYLLTKPAIKELHHLLNFIKDNLRRLDVFTKSAVYWGGNSVIKTVLPYFKIFQDYSNDSKIFGKNTNFYSTMPDLLLLNFYIMSIWRIGMFLDATVYLPDYITRVGQDTVKLPYNKLEEIRIIQRKSKLNSFNPFNHFELMRTSSDSEVNLYYDNATTLESFSMMSEIYEGLDFENPNVAFTNAMLTKSIPYELLLSKSKVELINKNDKDNVQIMNYKELIDDERLITFKTANSIEEFNPNVQTDEDFTYSVDKTTGNIEFQSWKERGNEYPRNAYLEILIDGKPTNDVGRIEIIQPIAKTSFSQSLQEAQTRETVIPRFTEQVKNSIYKNYNPRVINYYSQISIYVVYTVLLISFAWVAFFVYKKKSKI